MVSVLLRAGLMRLSFISALVCCASMGCVERPLGPNDEVTDDPVTNVSSVHGCGGSAPYCVDFCGSDWLQAKAECVDDDWLCPRGLRRIDLCPANTCWGPPASSAEKCSKDGWVCQPDADIYAACPGFICPECTGFTGPTTVAGCTCECKQGEVSCHRELDPEALLRWTWTAEGPAGPGVGSGGVEIRGDGSVRAWTPGSPGLDEYQDTLPLDDVAVLFQRLQAVSWSALPHSPVGFIECGVDVMVSFCGNCAPQALSYSMPSQVLPEVQPVWDWFAAHARDSITVADFTPARYCDF